MRPCLRAIGTLGGTLEVCGGSADEPSVLARLRSEHGFGLIELMMSMVMLNVGILAIVASFNSGQVALKHASETSSASVLGDKQMELYRALEYASIALDATSVASANANAVYAADPAYSASQITVTCASLDPECAAMRTTAGPDNRSYRVDTYIVADQINVASMPVGRNVKRVTIVVRRSSDLKTLARVSSIFDSSTG
jgi:Tfp pilus assembly protein PilV